jgi:hypothetical protein
VFNYASADPCEVEVCHAKISFFSSKNKSNSVSSLSDKPWEIIIVLSGTLGSSRTLFVSHSGSIAGLFMKASLL